jgi:GNAT superfamily N-acetyltransferase
MSVQENILSDPSKVTGSDYLSMIGERGRGWVCEINGHIIGFSIIDLQEKNVWALFILPQYEGRGIGKTLHNMMMQWASGQNIDRVWLSTGPSTRAEGFYRKMGWEEVGMMENGEIKFEWHF